MSKGQLAILPLQDGRTVERRTVNLAARLREPGATIADAEVLDLSTDGYMALTDLALEPGTTVWLKLPGLEAQNSRAVWSKDGKTGFQFVTPLHQTTIDMLVKVSRKPPPKRHFGPQA